MGEVSRHKAVVRNGRIFVDEATELPDGTVVEIVPQDPSAQLSAEELAKLDEALDRSAEQAAAGQLRPVADLLDELRASR